MTTAAARAVRPEDAPLVYQLLQRGRSDATIAAALGVDEAAIHAFYRARLLSAPPIAPKADGDLTPREEDVVRLLVQGRSVKETALALGIAYHTARSHLRNVMARYGFKTKLTLALWAKENGY